MVLKDLFGGAIVADFPDDFIDVSTLRQVPDTQEVFLRRGSDVSIIVEVLERVSAPTDEDAVKFHFEALAHDNDAISSTMQLPIVKQNDRGDRPSLFELRGSQRVRKFNKTDEDDVDIYIALFRVHSESKSADLVVSENIPKVAESGGGDKHAAEFSALVSSLRIVDYGLFLCMPYSLMDEYSLARHWVDRLLQPDDPTQAVVEVSQGARSSSAPGCSTIRYYPSCQFTNG